MTEDQPNSLVLDTSVWINLLATEAFDRILTALDAVYVAPEQVIREVIRDPVTKRMYTDQNHPLRRHQSVHVGALTPSELEVFLDLVGAAIVDRVGDGEAAAIAMASQRQVALVLDDGKARRVAHERFASVRLMRSGDLICHDAVVRQLGAEAAEECRRKAVQFGRNHLPITSLTG